jgi:mRNA interferase HigB
LRRTGGGHGNTDTIKFPKPKPRDIVSKTETQSDGAVHVISRKPFDDAAIRYPAARAALQRNYDLLRKGDFTTPDQLRNAFPTLDNFKYRDKWWVLDIAGNNLRLIAFIQFRDNRMYVKHIVNHTEYDALTKTYRETKE